MRRASPCPVSALRWLVSSTGEVNTQPTHRRKVKLSQRTCCLFHIAPCLFEHSKQTVPTVRVGDQQHSSSLL